MNEETAELPLMSAVQDPTPSPEELAALASEQAEAAASAALTALHDEASAENEYRDTIAAGLARIAAENANAVPEPLPTIDRVDAPGGSFGPTFWPELRAAGIDTLPFVASGDHVIFSPEIKPEDRAKVMAVIEAHDPEAKAPELPAPVIVVNAIDFYRRLKPEEGAKVEAAMAAQPFVKRRIFETANTFRSDAPNGEWELLVSLAEGLFDKDRAAELLAPSA